MIPQGRFGTISSSLPSVAGVTRFVAIVTAGTVVAGALSTIPLATASAAPSATTRLIVRTATALDPAAADSLVTRGGGAKHGSVKALKALVVDVPAGAAAATQAKYAKLPGVTSVELDHARKIAAAPND